MKPNVPKNPPGWEVRSEHQLFGHTVRMHQHRYMLVLQIDDLYLVAGVSEQGNITVPAKMAIVNDLDTAKAICDHALAMEAPGQQVESGGDA